MERASTAMERARTALPILFEQHEGAPLAKVRGLLLQHLLTTDDALSRGESQDLATRAMHEWNRGSSRASNQPRVLQFFSQSKDADDLYMEVPGWRKRLSNFFEHNIIVDGANFPSVEHYYQSAKFTLVGEHERAHAFETGGAVGRAALAAKKAGGRKPFEAAGVTLDAEAWAKISEGVMWRALQCRACCDAEFCAILREVHAQSVVLLHFERSGARSYWGGNVNRETGVPQGRNRLGEMLMKLGSLLAAEGGAEALQTQCSPEMVLTPEQKLATWTASAGSLVGMPMMTDDVEEPAGATNCEPPAPKRLRSDPRELRS